MANNGWIGVDLDGTLAFYDKWRGVEHVGDFIPEMVRKVNAVRALGFEVRIFTARACEPERQGYGEFLASIAVKCTEHFGTVLQVTNIKDFNMIELWDDRAVTVEHNTGRFLAPSTRDFGVALYEEAQKVDALKEEGTL